MAMAPALTGESGQIKQELLVTRPHRSPFHGVAISKDGHWIASANWDSVVLVWNAQTGKLVHQLAGHYNSANAAAFSPDGQRVASASWDQTVKVWDVRELHPVVRLQRRQHVTALAFSPDNRVLAAGGEDGVLRLWELASLRELMVVKGHASIVTTQRYGRLGEAHVQAEAVRIGSQLVTPVVTPAAGPRMRVPAIAPAIAPTSAPAPAFRPGSARLSTHTRLNHSCLVERCSTS